MTRRASPQGDVGGRTDLARAVRGGAALALCVSVLALASPGAGRAEAPTAFGALLEAMDRGDPAAATLAMSDAAALALTLPWRIGEGPSAAEALRLLASRLEALSAGRGKAGRRPWVPGEAALALGRLRPALGGESGEVARARQRLAELAGVPPRGAVLGPFGGAKPEGRAPGAAPTAVGVFGETAWRAFDGAASPDGLPVGDLLARSGDVHAWLVFDVEVAKPVNATLLLGSNGPLAVEVDGASVLTSDAERSASDWQHGVGLRLGPGRHRLTVGVGHPVEAPALRLRLVDGSGRLPASARWVPFDPGAALGSATVVAVEDPLPALARDAGRLAAFRARFPGPDDRAAVSAGDPRDCDGADACMRVAEALTPVDAGRARIALERAATRGHVPALASLIVLTEARGLVADADRFARALSALAPDHPAVRAHRALRLLEYGGGAGALEVLRSHPAADVNPRLASLVATLEERRGDMVAAAAAWERVMVLRGGASEPLQRAVFGALKAGRRDAARRAAAAARAFRPCALDPWLLEARVDAAVLPVAAIVDRLSALTALHGDDANLHALLGRLALLDADRTAAVAAFDRALALTPQDRALAEHRRALVADRPAGDGFFAPRDAIVAAGAAAPPAAEGALYLTDRRLVRVFDSGLASTFHQYAVRIDSDHAAERFAEQTFPFTPGEDRVELLEVEVLRGGERLRPEWVSDRKAPGKTGGVYTLTAFRVARLPPLRPGDIVHVQTRHDEIGERNLFGDFFGVFAPLSAPWPKRDVSVVIDAPATRRLAHTSSGTGLVGSETEEPDGRRRLSFTAAELPAVVVEPDMPGYGDVGAWVNVSTFGDWVEMVGWYRRLIAPQLEVTEALRRTTRDLVAGLGTTQAKVRAVHAWVLANTRYVGIEFGIHGFKPYHVAEVVRRGYGDCKDKAGLLVAMLREVGVPAEFVLVRTRDYGRLGQHPATLWAFNHAIAYVPELDLYLDATAERSGLGELPDLDQGAQMLRFDPWSGTPPVLGEIPMQTATDNRVESRTRWALDARGEARAGIEEVAFGTSAARLRHIFHDPSRRLQVLGEMFSSQHSGAQVVSATFDGLDGLGVPVAVRAVVEIPGRAQRAGAVWRIPVSTSPGRLLQRWGTLASRTQPLVLRALEEERIEEHFVLPEGAEVVSTPADRTLETPFGAFAMTVRRTENPREVVVAMTVRPTMWWIPPDAYPAWRAFASEIARAEGEAIIARW